MPRPLVSVIIPTYNCARTLRLAVASVLAQDLSDFEIQIVGDGCTDNSEGAVRSLNDQRVFWTNLPNNTGTPSAPRNEGLRRARGSYLAYLGHDDLWFPWHLSSLVAAMESGQDFAHSLGVCHGNQHGTEGPNFAFSLPTEPAIATALVSPSNWMLTRAFADRLGPWNTELLSAVDKDVLRRAWHAGMTVACTGRLSVVRFPSWEWAPYRPDAACPQGPVIEAMQRDAVGLEHQLLTALAAWVAKQPHATPPSTQTHSEWGLSLLYLRAALMTAYGRERWPLRWLVQRLETRNNRRQRGLPLDLR